MIEGGTHTVRAVLEYVTDTPPVPVVVCDGSGRAADLIAFVHKYSFLQKVLSVYDPKVLSLFVYFFLSLRYASESGEQTVLESMKEYLLNTIMKTFEVGAQQAECLYNELLQCTRRKNLVSLLTQTHIY